MPITFFKSANSVNKYINQKNPTQTDLAKAKDLLGKKIDHVLNKLQSHAHKRNIDISLISTGLRSNSDPMVKIGLSTGRLLANALIKITSHNTTAKDRAYTKEFSTLSMSLVKYSSQLEAIKNKEEISSILTKGKIAVPTPQQKALNNLKILINYVNSKHESLKQEGIFRISGVKTGIDSLAKVMNNGSQEKIQEKMAKIDNAHIIFSAIKEQFKLALTDSDKAKILSLINTHETGNQQEEYKITSINNLPPPLQQLIPLLSSIKQYKKENKMDANNLAIIFAPQITHIEGKTLSDIENKIKNNTDFLSTMIQATAPLLPPRSGITQKML